MLTGRLGADPNVVLLGSSGSSSTLISTSTQFLFNSSSTTLSGTQSLSTSWSGNLRTVSSSSSQSSSSLGASSISSTWSSSQLSNTGLSTFPYINPSSSTQIASSRSSTSSESISPAAGFQSSGTLPSTFRRPLGSTISSGSPIPSLSNSPLYPYPGQGTLAQPGTGTATSTTPAPKVAKPSGQSGTFTSGTASGTKTSGIKLISPNGTLFGPFGSRGSAGAGIFPPSLNPLATVASGSGKSAFGPFITNGPMSGGLGTGAIVPASITAAPTPISFLNGQPVFAANATLPPTYDSGILSLAYLGGNCSMSPGTDGYNAKSCSCVNSIVKWYYSYATATITTQQCQLTMIEGIATGAQSLGCSYNTVTELATPYVAPTDCCNKCDVRASAVQLVYWPPKPTNVLNTTYPSNYSITAAPAAPVAEASGIVSNGFTFVSPSVYVVYSGISAQASCVALLNSQTQVGPEYTVTRAYAPDALSSARCVAPGSEGMGIAYYFNGPGPPGYFQGIFNGWEAINYAELANPPPGSVLLSRYQSCFSNPIDSVFASQMFATPQLSFPPDVTDIDPEWQAWGAGTCTPIDLGVMDPPRALGSASALGPGIVTAAVSPDMISTGAAAPGITAALPYDPRPSPLYHAPSFLLHETALLNPSLSTAQNLGSINPAAVTPGSDPLPSADPDNEPPAEMSLLSQVLDPSPTPPQPQAVPTNNPITLAPVQPAATAQVPANVPTTPAPIIPVAQPLPSISNQPILQNTNSDLIIGGSTTLAPGSQTTLEGHAISNGGSSVVVDGNTQALQTPAAPSSQPAPAVVVAGQSAPSIGGHPILQDTNSNLVVGGSTTLAPGSQTIVAGQTVSNGASNVVVDGNTQALQPPAEPSQVAAPAIVAPSQPPPHVGGQPILQNANSQLIVAGTTVPPNSQTVVAGHTVLNGASKVVIDGNTQVLQPQPTITPVPALPSVGGQAIVQNPNSDLIVRGSTIPSGSQAVVAGHTVSNGGSNVVVDGNTQALPVPTAAVPMNQIVQVSNGNLQVGGQIIAPGSQATVAGHVVNFANPTQVIVDGTTNSISPITSQAPLIVGGQTAYQAPGGGLIVGTSTLAPGSQATISGQVFSLDGSSSVAVDGSTYSLPPTQNAYIMHAVQPVSTGHITLSNGLVVTPAASPATPGAYPALNLPNGAIISAGGPTAVISGTTYSVLPSNQGLLVNGASTLALPPLSSAPQSIFSVAGQTFTAAPTGFSIAGTTVSPGGQVVIISGTAISLNSFSQLQIGSSTITLSQSPETIGPEVFTVAGQTFTAAPTGFPIAGSSLTPGGSPIYLSGTLVSLDASSHLQIGSSTINLGIDATSATQSVFAVAGQTFTAEPTGFTIDGTTLTPGGSAITISGTAVSLAPGGSLAIGSSTIALPSQTVFIVGGQTFTAEPTGFNIASTSISPGQAVTISGTLVSLGPSGTLVVGLNTMTLPTQSVFTVDGQTFTAEATGFVLEGAAVAPGGPGVTISGVDISLGTNSVLHIGSQTLATLGAAAPSSNGPSVNSTGAGIGEAIVSAFGTPPFAPTGAHSGGGSRAEAWRIGLAGFVGVGIGAVAWVL